PTTRRASHSFKHDLPTLRALQPAGDAAARALPNRAPLDFDTPNTHYTPLHQSRLQAVMTEARIQPTLAQRIKYDMQLTENA
ncbi:hypothetical protein C7A09_28235, partial [Pseudomonas fluorescens]